MLLELIHKNYNNGPLTVLTNVKNILTSTTKLQKSLEHKLFNIILINNVTKLWHKTGIKKAIALDEQSTID